MVTGYSDEFWHDVMTACVAYFRHGAQLDALDDGVRIDNQVLKWHLSIALTCVGTPQTRGEHATEIGGRAMVDRVTPNYL